MAIETSFIVYTANDSLYIEGNRYTSKGRAQAAMRRAKKYDGSPKYPEGDYEVLTRTEFDARDIMVPTVNMMNGKLLEIRKSQKGGCCDPATERYWSM